MSATSGALTPLQLSPCVIFQSHEPPSLYEGFALRPAIVRSRNGENRALLCAVSMTRAIDCFLSMLDVLPRGHINILLMQFHPFDRHAPDENRIYTRMHVDSVVLQSVVQTYAALLLRNGNIHLSAFGSKQRTEVQLDCHKQVVCFGNELAAFTAAAEEFGLPHRDSMLAPSDYETALAYAEEDRREFEQFLAELQLEEGDAGSGEV